MNVRTNIAEIIFNAQNHTNMYDGESLSFYAPDAFVERTRAYNAADDLIAAGFLKEDAQG